MKFHKDGTLPENNEIWVFGSNLAGRHGAGAARVAFEKFGAKDGFGHGRINQSYAIPTKDARIKTLPLDEVEFYAGMFKAYARMSPQFEFFVTAIGCGLAGYKHEEIAPMFKDAPDNCSFPEEWKEYL